jgi:hypothetical protein
VTQLTRYLDDDESPVATAPASLRSVAASEGRLAVTDRRVVFAAEGAVTDVDRSAVTALRFREARYPLANAVGGAVAGVVGLFLALVATTGAGVPVTTALGSGLLVVGAATFLLGLRERAARLELHTPAQSFEFAGDGEDLAALPSAIRAPPAEPGGSESSP